MSYVCCLNPFFLLACLPSSQFVSKLSLGFSHLFPSFSCFFPTLSWCFPGVFPIFSCEKPPLLQVQGLRAQRSQVAEQMEVAEGREAAARRGQERLGSWEKNMGGCVNPRVSPMVDMIFFGIFDDFLMIFDDV